MNASTDWYLAPAAAIDQDAVTQAEARQAVLTKPPGALGRLESLAVRLAGMQGRVKPMLERIAITVFAADQDEIVPSRVAAETLVSGIPGARLRRIPDAGHLLLPFLAEELLAWASAPDGAAEERPEGPGEGDVRQDA